MKNGKEIILCHAIKVTKEFKKQKKKKKTLSDSTN